MSLILRINKEEGECIGPLTGATHYHAQLGLSDKYHKTHKKSWLSVGCYLTL